MALTRSGTILLLSAREAIQAAGQPAVTALPKLSICLVDTIAGTIGLEMRHLELTFYHQPLQLRDGLCGVQSLRADLRAVRDGVAAIELEWIFEVIETACPLIIAAVCNSAPSSQ
jgi:hypothetical protein